MTRYMEDEVSKHRRCCPKCVICPECRSTLSHVNMRDKAGTVKTRLSCGYCFWVSSDKITEAMNEMDHNALETDVKVAEVDRRYMALLEDLSRSTSEQRDENRRTGVEKLDYNINMTLMDTFPCESKSKPIIIHHLPFKTKRTVRCRRDVETGKMSILLQPKNLPLEGDSSLKLQRGKWSIKDSSAMYYVPYVSSKFADDLSCRPILSLRNPMDNAITVVLNPIELSDGVFPVENLNSFNGTISTFKEASPEIELEVCEDILLQDVDEVDRFYNEPLDLSKLSTDKPWVMKTAKNRAILTTSGLINLSVGQGDMEKILSFALTVRKEGEDEESKYFITILCQ
jgi:hypothetical protein